MARKVHTNFETYDILIEIDAGELSDDRMFSDRLGKTTVAMNTNEAEALIKELQNAVSAARAEQLRDDNYSTPPNPLGEHDHLLDGDPTTY